RPLDRNPQQILRVDVEHTDELSTAVEQSLLQRLSSSWNEWDIVLVSDYGKGVCTPSVLRIASDEARRQKKRILVDPRRGTDYGRYRNCHCLTPNRRETQLVTNRPVETAAEALAAASELQKALNVEAVVVTLDREGMALAHENGRCQVFPTRER